MTFTNPFQLL